MLIPLNVLIKKHKLEITGIIHVGAHWAEEHGDYEANGIHDIAYIEPCKNAFQKLQEKRFNPEKVVLFNTALADYEGVSVMHVEKANNGQSNSLLKPGTHTKHYPSITFKEEEEVKVTTLDSLLLNNGRYNMLNIDVQGAELMVLRGGAKTLEHIDYIYTECNKEEVYQGCGLVQELDALLYEFKRVETAWTGQGWGDALYIRVKPQKPVAKSPFIEKVPDILKPKHPFPYPPDNKTEFERWFMENVTEEELNGCQRTYLPIMWTAYQVKSNYGKNKFQMNVLQRFLNRLDKNKKYFTVVQYDDGILANLTGLDIQIFGMGGGRIDYPLPLICEPHRFKFDIFKKDILCSYIGANTHNIRQKIVDTLKDVSNFYISQRKHPLNEFCSILARSKYVLCPRGYGKTSFRIMEALQYGATPVYVSDEHILPRHTESDFIIVHEKDIFSIPEIINKFEKEKGLTPTVNKEIFKLHYTYEVNKQIILEKIKA